MNPELHNAMARVQALHWWFVARRRILADCISALSLPASADILEVGCGTGGNLAMLSRFGRLQAVEYDAEARAVAAGLGVCTVHAGGLPEPLPFSEERFDLICLLDVLEHVDEDQESLARLRRLLKPEGRLLLTVPAYRWLWSEHDVEHHHRRRYTAGQLRTRAHAAGLVVVRLGYFNSLLFPIVAAVRLASKLTRRAGNSGLALPSPPLNCLLTEVFGLERHVVPYALFPAGTSVLALLAPRV